MAQVCLDAGFTKHRRSETMHALRPEILLEEMGITNTCVGCTPSLVTRSDAEPNGVGPKNTRIRHINRLLITRQYGRCGTIASLLFTGPESIFPIKISHQLQ